MFVALILEVALHLSELLLQAAALQRLGRELVIETCPSHTTTTLEKPTTNSEKKDNKRTQSLTVHLLLELLHLLLVPVDILGELSSHTLGVGLQIPFHPELTLEGGDPPSGVGKLLAC